MSTQSNVLLAHPGIQYALNLAREMYRIDKLNSFHTSLAINAELNITKWIYPLIKTLKLEKPWQNRYLYGVPPSKLHCYPTLEIKAWWQINQGIPINEVFWERNNNFQKQIPLKAIDTSQIVIGFDTSSHILSARVKAQDKIFILDRSIGHPRSSAIIAETIRETFPEWKDTWEIKSEMQLISEDIEHQLADVIVVPSRFVFNSLVDNGVSQNKIIINPFGTDVQHFHPASEFPKLDPLIFLYVGRCMARKGLPLLLSAWQQLQPTNAELWIAGTGKVPEEIQNQSPNSVRWLGSISREKLPQLFQQAHVFIFPSFFEGLAQVQLEAAACGLPIIATTASGSEEIVEEGKTGFIIESGNLEQLIKCIHKFLNRPSLAVDMHKAAKERASMWSWSNYGDRWQKILQQFS